MSNVSWINRDAEIAAMTAKHLRAEGHIKPDRTNAGGQAWRYSVTEVSHLSEGLVHAGNCHKFGFEAVPGQPGWVRMSSSASPATVISRMLNMARAAA